MKRQENNSRIVVNRFCYTIVLYPWELKKHLEKQYESITQQYFENHNIFALNMLIEDEDGDRDIVLYFK